MHLPCSMQLLPPCRPAAKRWVHGTRAGAAHLENEGRHGATDALPWPSPPLLLPPLQGRLRTPAPLRSDLCAPAADPDPCKRLARPRKAALLKGPNEQAARARGASQRRLQDSEPRWALCRAQGPVSGAQQEAAGAPSEMGATGAA